jgi:hypothetical protein
VTSAGAGVDFEKETYKADLPERQLGRTGLQVTMLGYGAMELRGAPRARDISDGQAETILRAVLVPASTILTRRSITALARPYRPLYRGD